MVWQSKILRLPKFEIYCLKNKKKDMIDQRVPSLLWSTIVDNNNAGVITSIATGCSLQTHATL